MSTTTDILDRLDAAVSEAEIVNARIAAHVTRPAVCNPDDFHAHVVAADEADQAPIFGSCSPSCSLL